MTDNPDLHCARGWLARASDVLTGAEDYLSAVEYAHAAAVIGNGYVNLAHATRALDAMAESAKVTARQLEAFDAIADAADRTGDPTLEAAAEREERAAAEARPHDDEPVNLCESDADAARRFAGRIQAALAVVDEVLPKIDLGDGAAGADALERVRAALTSDRPNSEQVRAGVEQIAVALRTTPEEVVSQLRHAADEALRADRHAEITEAERSEEVHGG